MSVIAIPMSTRLTLRLNTGLDEEFNPVYRNRSWSNVKHGVNHETLHTLGTQFASLQEHTLDRVQRTDSAELELE